MHPPAPDDPLPSKNRGFGGPAVGRPPPDVFQPVQRVVSACRSPRDRTLPGAGGGARGSCALFACGQHAGFRIFRQTSHWRTQFFQREIRGRSSAHLHPLETCGGHSGPCGGGLWHEGRSGFLPLSRQLPAVSADSDDPGCRPQTPVERPLSPQPPSR